MPFENTSIITSFWVLEFWNVMLIVIIIYTYAASMLERQFSSIEIAISV